MCYEDVDEMPESHVVVRSFKTGKLTDVGQFVRLTRNDTPAKVESAWKGELNQSGLRCAGSKLLETSSSRFGHFCGWISFVSKMFLCASVTKTEYRQRWFV